MTGGTSGIAVVGIDCRFAGAPDKDALWNMMMRGDDGIVDIPDHRWDTAAYYSPDGRPGTANTRSAGLISDPDTFDHEFFGISPREAAAMDPQQRMLLQSSWRAVEDAGMDPTSLGGGMTGVYVGVMSSEWALLRMTDYSQVGADHVTGNGYHMAANRVSYHLDLRGPSIAVDTACSSSLVAVDLAANALRAGECELAIVAGVNLVLTPALSILYTQAGLSAPDGRCKPFSGRANGIGRGEGVGVVVLRRLADAMADDQLIYAVIDGSAVSHDGRSNGITAPNRWSQIQVIRNAYHRAGIDPCQVSFVEGHGTGTVLGDMIEVKALGAVHGVDRAQPCVLGSVKGNIGHAEGAAGIAGLIKACLTLERRVLPPSLHSEHENPDLRLAASGLRLARTPVPLSKGMVRAAVSSFGLGGTNAHVVLSTSPQKRHCAEPGERGVLTVSAGTAQGLYRNLAIIADMVERAPRERLTQICHSTNVVRSSLPHRFAVVASSRDELTAVLRDQLRDWAARPPGNTRASSTPRPVFLFTGQGAEYTAMTRPLYRSFSRYRERLDMVDAAMRPHLGRSIAALVLDSHEQEGQREHDTARAQPATFAVGYALGGTLLDLGVEPDAMLGYSAGEYAAASLAGVLTLDEACRLIVARGRLTQELTRAGAMIAVRASVDEVRPYVEAEPLAAIAAFNGPRDVVISGDTQAVGRIRAALTNAGTATLPLRVSHGFHSPLMLPVLRAFAGTVGDLSGRMSTVPIASTMRGRVVRGEEMDSGYWIEQVTAPVQFEAAMRAVLERRPTHLIEIGTRPVLLALARRAGAGRDLPGLVPCPGPDATGHEVAEVLAALYRDGMWPRWRHLYTPGQRVPWRLPPYQFSNGNRPPATVGTAVKPATPAKPTEPAEPAEPAEPSTRDEPVGSIEQQVVAALAELGGYQAEQLRADSRLREDLGYDSIMVVRFSDRLAEILRTDAPLPVAELLPHLTTVGDVLAYVSARSTAS